MRNATELIADSARAVRANGLKDLKNVPSPCISVCQMDAATQQCAGCLRTLDEIAAWGGLDEQGRLDIWALIEQRASA